MREPWWVPIEAIKAIHLELIAEHGGLPGVRDEGLLESALARPRNLWAYEKPTLYDLAAAYGFGLTKNHALVDGNKRIGLAAIDVFLRMNGSHLTASEAEAVAVILKLAEGKLDQADLAAWIAKHAGRSGM